MSNRVPASEKVFDLHNVEGNGISEGPVTSGPHETLGTFIRQDGGPLSRRCLASFSMRSGEYVICQCDGLAREVRACMDQSKGLKMGSPSRIGRRGPGAAPSGSDPKEVRLTEAMQECARRGYQSVLRIVEL